jgi:hypothetical protein
MGFAVAAGVSPAILAVVAAVSAANRVFAGAGMNGAPGTRAT